MHSFSFFFGDGKLRIWYLTFYLVGLPLYLFGLYLLIKTAANPTPALRDFVLTVFAFGYLLLGIFSLVNTLLYAYASKRFFWSFFIFLGIQILFWAIGTLLGNNYGFLFVFFLLFLVFVVYVNLFALHKIQHHRVKKSSKKED